MINKQEEKKVFSRRIKISLFGLIVALSCLIINLVSLQLFNYKKYKAKSEKNYTKQFTLKPAEA